MPVVGQMRLVPRSDLATCGILGISEKRCFTWLVARPLSIALCAHLARRVTRCAPCDTCRDARGHNLDPFRRPDPAGSPFQRSLDRESPCSRRQVDFAPGPDPGRAGGRRNQDFGPAGGRGRAQHRQIHAGAGRKGGADRTDFAWSVRGVGVAGFAEPAAPLDFGNSGTGCRLVMGAVAGCPITAVFDGDASLRSRPMRRILDPLELMGARTGETREGGRLPLTLHGARDPAADPLQDAGGLGADQIRGAAGGAGRARRHHGDRAARPAATTPS